MGLLTIIRKDKIKSNEKRCLILGLDNSGKTSIVNQLLRLNHQHHDDNITPTIGFKIYTLNLKDKIIQLWDIGGQFNLRPYWDNYFDKTDILIWVIDINNPIKLNESYQEFSKVLKEKERLQMTFDIIIILNKIDLIPSNIVLTKINEISNHITDLVHTSQLTSSAHIEIFSTSAVTISSEDGKLNQLPLILNKFV